MPKRVNLSTNPNVVTGGSGYSFFPAGGTAALSQGSDSTAPSGSGKTALVTWSAAATSATAFMYHGILSTTTPMVPASPGQVFSQGVWFKTSVSGQTFTLQCRFYDSTDALLASTISAPITPAAGVWTWAKIENATAPANTSQTIVMLLQGGGTLFGVGSTLAMGGAIIERAATEPGYFDGSTAPAYWNGTANASTSTMPVIDVAFDTVSMRSKLTLDGFQHADGPMSITRVHPDGSSFLVRDMPNLSAGSAFTVDYELPFGTAIYYTCQDTNGLVQSPLSTLATAQFWLRVPGQPDYDNPIEVEAKPVIVRAKPQTVLRPLGRANPVVLSGTRDNGSFDLHVRTVTGSDVANLLGSLNAGSTLLLVMPGSRLPWVYVVAGDATETPVAPWQSQVDGDAGSQSQWVIPCIVVDRPAGGMLADSGFSYATLLADWSTYSAMLAANTSYLKLMSGL